ncbi:hypothetical protein PN465_16425 [Nodularia spumigena CS-584]|uniref:hypothetical protein n=1 Tax=Nodularia spumigena TaxID=70799 RepID=UPI0012F4C0E0|nr:hypothetical protein [Nodularia spumigena]MDB9383789.1 hypothetical protein [Nodularia spumigena CS-584]
MNNYGISCVKPERYKDAIIHEWRESAIAIASPDLAAAFNDQTDEIPLTQPSISGGG